MSHRTLPISTMAIRFDEKKIFLFEIDGDLEMTKK
jgi:hypothetical protein